MSVTREELHALVERVHPEEFDRAAHALSTLAENPTERRRLPRSLGMVKGEPTDSERVDDLLAGGFGR